MPIAPFPHHYTLTLQDETLGAAPRSPIRIGAPPEFGGSDEVWSPEQLLIGAAAACLKTTFDAYAKREGVAVTRWVCAASGTLIKGREGPVFESITLDVEVSASAGDEARVQALVASAESRCIVTRALAAPVRVTCRVLAVGERAAS